MKGVRYLRVRRILDVLVVVVSLPVLVPAGVAVASTIALVDRQRPFIRLRRSGRNRTDLRITKLQTMRTTETPGSAITGSNDLRVTPLGRRLRAWRLDEIPQVIDVLRGDMALIGPRPEDPAFVNDDDRWDEVLSASPGIAGLAQIVAAPWEAEHLGNDVERLYAEVAVPAKLAIDSWYVANASPRTDWTIVTSLARVMLLNANWTQAHQLISDQVPGAAALCSAPVA